jgi:AcrR family transcriptional regulator
VAKAVGRTPPSIYLHFPDKNTLLYSVCDRLFASLADLSARAQEGIDDPVERIRRCAHAYVQFAVDSPAVYRILLLEPHDWLESMSMEQLKADVAFRSLYDNVVAAFDQGHFRPGDPDVVSLTMWMSIHGIASILITTPSFQWPPKEVLVDTLLDSLLHGLLAD